ncbi:uncharacterized protein TRIVIDRAFT_159440 [Trichoderma virens Gv29-8]|uniref:Uncharacterized protein n=1 Tax=Hypocrea virens (strain Gv29-8 / FGSC 10586) TaxID=413071 RepID=G9N5V6_HYPVG|nr:uncharacterized protein TRIVIDRAFT_159440 [Trichoderma virens Gv29-8]EHK18147.1 hypothetical protein TRIVIDRAFT_159440 [Trichoderma virens Gv29-8]
MKIIESGAYQSWRDEHEEPARQDPMGYTIGWICAIEKEYVAAQVFLDEKYERPDRLPPNDNNKYTLGRIGKHNIVIAVLPNGKYGVSSAAGVARDMLHSFPNIRIGLLVGIGGGAPSLTHDIRLGDVIVGVSNNGKSAVFQYDFRKAIQGQEFLKTGFLNQPPPVLRTAINGLMAQYEIEGNQLREAVDSVLNKNPRLRKRGYMRPEAITDRLYRSQVIHPLNSGTSCATVCGDDPSSLIKRHQREEDDDDPLVHYGLIASANMLMKDALVRDELIAKEGILCFEMGAAGLMNHFPCLVIRGICDYSDSHKSTLWQGYAAMTAAAYAKDLLHRIAPIKVEAQKKISDVLSENHLDIAEHHRDIAKEEPKSLEDFANERLSKEEQECHQLFRLTSGGKDTTYEWYKDRIDERVENTCLWLLQNEHYQKWLKQESGPLLVTADPGCGKSVLAKYLIDHGLPRPATTHICYFFFKDEDQDTSHQALCALLHQIFSQMPFLIKHAMQSFRNNGENLITHTDSLWTILQDVTRDPEAGSIIIVLDALDECAESEFMDLMRNIESQFNGNQLSGTKSKLKYLLTCRPYEQIITQFHKLLNSFPNIHIPGEDESAVICQEIDDFIKYQVSYLPLSAGIKIYLQKRLQEIPHRTYLWVYLIFDYIKQGNFKMTLQGAESIIQTLPKSVNEAYEQILNKSTEKRMVRKALSIILAASRPLTLSEMNIAMNIKDMAQDDTTQTFYDLDLENEMDFKSRLRSWCGLVISIYRGKIYFFHQTAREFLLAAYPTSIPSTPYWHHSITTRHAHSILAELCVLYLNLFNSSTIEMDMTPSYFTDRNAFLNYSAENWGYHFHKAHITDNAAIIPATLRICDPSSKSFLAWFKTYQRSKNLSPDGHITDLLIATHYGHHAIVKVLVENGADIEAKDSMGRTPLSQAAENGHEAIVKLLVEKGADIEAKDLFGQTPLSQAAENGHEAIVKLLVENGADIEAKDGVFGRTPLLWAIESGHEAIMQLLVEKGADIEVKDIMGRTPLLQAAENGHEAIVKLLVEKRADSK